MRRGKTFWSMAVSIVLVLSLFLSACSGGGGSEDTGSSSGDSEGNTEKELADKQELHFREPSDLPSADLSKATAADAHALLERVKAGLIFIENGKAVPDMAAEMPKVSDDGKTYTFTIRDDAVWSDGSPVTAQNFVYSWRRGIDPDTASQYAYIFGEANIKNATKITNEDSDLYGKVKKLGVKALDKHTLQVKLEQATPYFTSMMSFATFYPLKKSFVEKQGEDYAQEPENLLYNGAYTFKEWDHGSSYTIVKNDKYWNADKVNIEKATFNVVKKTNTAINLYKKGKIDLVGLSGDRVDKYKDSSELSQILDNCVYFLKLNLDTDPALKNKKVRQAMSMVMNRKEATDVLMNNGSIPAQYIVPKDFVKGPNGKDFRAGVDDYLPGDQKEAKKLWKEAKEELGFDTIELELLTTDSEYAGKLAENNANALEQLPGLKVSINKQPWNSYLKKSNTGNYEIAGGSGWCPDYRDPMTYLSLFVSSNESYHPVGWESDKFDSLINKANQLGNQQEKRWDVLHQAEENLIKEAAIIPTYQKGVSQLVKPYVEGMKFQNYGLKKFFRYAKVYKH
ncbi:peptide ABC transporter substrate-binding protein [Tuberibacillus sp. Marseille-P3662]|uniref:peptide ABC transporter substrate-binding protein n=1 Tax=Tuberibacillus sp. Marseille-P3662 TaxID=1965358 RepID=UPI000A1CE68A|nr:peptide ABC transporter substrate-binding protein [Tuberibacillus sp. Marseille-P3662]